MLHHSLESIYNQLIDHLGWFPVLKEYFITLCVSSRNPVISVIGNGLMILVSFTKQQDKTLWLA